MNILFVCSECSPFVKTGGLADVLSSLPNVLSSENVNSYVMLPLYKKVKNNHDLEFVGSSFVTLFETKKYVGIFKTVLNNVTYFFIDNEEYFNFDELYGKHNDDLRFTFFNLAVIESLHIIKKDINIIHINDWHTGLIPFFLKYIYKYDIKTIFTIHNIQYQGIFSLDLCKAFNYYNNSLEFNGHINFMKCAIMESSIITTVSKSYRDETLISAYGLESILRYRQDDYYGIINGIDTSLFNPSNDKNIYYNYSNYDDKYHNKLNFCQQYNLNTNLLCGFVSRLCNQKGIDLILDSLDEILHHTTMNFFFLGSGDEYYENKLKQYSSLYPNRIKIHIGYSETLASMIYASCDMVIVPSQFEPCGLTQMIAMRYGTLPLVRETGGLKDTVHAYNKFTKQGNGFSFKNYSTYDFKKVIYLANDIYTTTDWVILANNAMNSDFSFNCSAKEYLNIYKLGE